ncbi:TPA: hypothetical protein ACH3X2_006176 [Trebouxia sp. C0005]
MLQFSLMPLWRQPLCKRSNQLQWVLVLVCLDYAQHVNSCKVTGCLIAVTWSPFPLVQLQELKGLCMTAVPRVTFVFYEFPEDAYRIVQYTSRVSNAHVLLVVMLVMHLYI